QFWQTNWKRGFAISTESRWASHAARAGSQWQRTGGTRGRGAAYSNLPSHIIPVIPPSEGCQQLVGNRACRLGHFVDRHVGAEELDMIAHRHRVGSEVGHVEEGKVHGDAA